MAHPSWLAALVQTGRMEGHESPRAAGLDVDAGWRFVSIGFEGQPTDVGGVDPWSVDWTVCGGRITVAHPVYPSQRHVMTIYEVTGSVPPIRFAAGEFSNGAWGFFVPE